MKSGVGAEKKPEIICLSRDRLKYLRRSHCPQDFPHQCDRTTQTTQKRDRARLPITTP
ncbi:MAG: hypothetical protein AAGA60_32815 [Cyanobacteria bacterium P01_E01_bin.42]